MADRAMYPESIENKGITILPADTTTPKDLLTAGSSGARVDSISVVSDDTAEMVLNVYMHDGTTAFLIGAITVPTLSGTDGVAPAVSVLNLTDMPFLPEDLTYFLAGTHKIQVGVQTTVTTAKTVTVVAMYADY